MLLTGCRFSVCGAWDFNPRNNICFWSVILRASKHQPNAQFRKCNSSLCFFRHFSCASHLSARNGLGWSSDTMLGLNKNRLHVSSLEGQCVCFFVFQHSSNHNNHILFQVTWHLISMEQTWDKRYLVLFYCKSFFLIMKQPSYLTQTCYVDSLYDCFPRDYLFPCNKNPQFNTISKVRNHLSVKYASCQCLTRCQHHIMLRYLLLRLPNKLLICVSCKRLFLPFWVDFV